VGAWRAWKPPGGSGGQADVRRIGGVEAGETFQALADAALRSSQGGAFLETAKAPWKPLEAEIAGDWPSGRPPSKAWSSPWPLPSEKLDAQVRELEKARQESQGALGEQLRSLAEKPDPLHRAAQPPDPRPLGR